MSYAKTSLDMRTYLMAFTVTPSGSHLIVCSRSLSLHVYSFDASTTDHVLEPTHERTLKPHAAPVITSATDGTGTLFATGGAEGLVKVWDISGGYVTHTFRGHGGIISALHFFEIDAGDLLNSGRTESAFTSHHQVQKNTKRKAKEQTDELHGGSRKSFRLASGDEEGKIRVWDLNKRKCLSVLDSHVSVVRAIDYDSKNHVLVSGSRDKTIAIWDVRTWKLKKIVPVLESVESAGFLAGGKLIYTGGEQGIIRLWRTKSGKETTEAQQNVGEEKSIVQIVHHQRLDFLLSVHNDHSLVLRSVKLLALLSEEEIIPPIPVIRQISGTHDEIIDLAYLMPDRSLLALATNSEDLRIISVAKTASTEQMERSDDRTSQFFGADVASLSGHQDIIICLDVDWSGHWLATGAKDNTARLWCTDPNGSGFTCVATFSGHAESLGAIALPKNRPLRETASKTKPIELPPPFLITGSQDQTVKCWDVTRPGLLNGQKKQPQARYTRKAHDKDINCLDINHNASMFASASQDRTVKIWSIEEGEVQGILRGHRRGVWSVRFGLKNSPSITGHGGSASGSRGTIVTGSGDKTVKIWNLTDYSCLRTLEGHTNSVLSVIWMPVSAPNSTSAKNGSSDRESAQPERQVLRIASAGGDGLVKVWDAISGEISCTLDNHTDRVWALAVNPRTNTVVSGGGDGVITFWKDTTSQTAAAAQTAATQRVEQEQQLQNLTHAKAYREAITLALQMNHPARLLALFTSVLHTSPPEKGSLSGVRAVDDVLVNLADEQIFLLLLRIRYWNTNARTASVAQRLLWVLVKSYPAERFVDLSKKYRRAGGGGRGRDGESIGGGGERGVSEGISGFRGGGVYRMSGTLSKHTHNGITNESII